MNAIDTNVLIYAYDERDPVKRTAATLLIESMSDGVLLWQVACEFVAASRKLAATGFTMEVAWRRLRELRLLFPLIAPSSSVLDRAAELMHETQVQYWDAMIYAACMDAGVAQIYSEDVPGAPIRGLEIVNPFA